MEPTNPNARRAALLASGLILLLNVPPLVASEANLSPLPREDAPDAIALLAGALNAEVQTLAKGPRANSCSGGEDCGACEASVDCGEGFTAQCSCSPTGAECWSWFHKKQVYSCTCNCVKDPTPPPPEEICIPGVMCVPLDAGTTGGRDKPSGPAPADPCRPMAETMAVMVERPTLLAC